MRVIRNQERDRSEALSKSWAARDEELKKNEALFADLQKQVAEFPAKLKTETEKAASIAGNSVKRDYEHQFELLKKDSEVAAKMSANTIESLQTTIANQNSVITTLQAKLTDAEKKVETIATKALDAASGRQTLAELQSLRSDNGAPYAARKT
jgi:predicted  nucleic acid-binding Zn-ribbon protein